ncbi:MAG: hypothetical protein JWM90_2883 [Thermoleophilia bacterium]|nr:hypothetical protein [Thermoleophilia bacterium]
MQISANPLKVIAQAGSFGAINGAIPAGISGAGVLRFIGGEAGDEIKVSGALTADSLMPGAALGAAISAQGSLDAMMPFGAKARLELTTEMSPPSPALASYMELLKTNAGAIDALQSNVDDSTLTTPDEALAFLRTLKSDEFVFAAQSGERTILWRGTEAQLPAGLADVVRGSDQLFGTLA